MQPSRRFAFARFVPTPDQRLAIVAYTALDPREIPASVAPSCRLLYHWFKPVLSLAPAAALDVDVPALRAVVQHDEESVRPCSDKRRHVAILAVAAYLAINWHSRDRDSVIETTRLETTFVEAIATSWGNLSWPPTGPTRARSSASLAEA